jgi:hypothetical protein
MREDRPTTDLLSRLPGVDMDDVAIRRLRQRVLDAVADERPARTRSTEVGKRLAIAVITATVIAGSLVVGAVALWPPRQGVDQRPAFAANVLAEVFTEGGTVGRWSRRVSDGTEWIELAEGHFHLRVREHGPGERIAVQVPDGRIEDVGTLFDVVVSKVRTTRVVVEEGSVVLRLEGAPAVTLMAGQVWEPPHEAVADDVAPPPGPALHPASDVRATGTGRGHRHRSEESPNAVDQRAEDEAYLNVIRLLHAARRNEARVAARDYLRRFPDGFRREEMRDVIP